MPSDQQSALDKLNEAREALKAKHKKERDQLNAKLKDVRAREKNKKRKDDTRRKIIAGALALNHMDKNPNSDFAKKLDGLLDEYVTKDQERTLFGLSPLSPDGQTKQKLDE